MTASATASVKSAQESTSVAKSLRGAEIVGVVGAVIALYCTPLYVMHLRASVPSSESVEHTGFWGTLPSAWDHPEPNYVVSTVIGEFWSVMTTIPVAGALLLYEGLKYRYHGKVVGIYVLTCAMYTLAFTAHLTLHKMVFSTTVISVMSNALLAFAQFSYVVHRLLESRALRGSIVLVAEAALVSVVATLPYALEAHGGVWTLFTVQSPGVFLATGLAAGLWRKAKIPEEQTTFRLVSISGTLLSTAMALSLVECLVGFSHGFLSTWWGFPWLHIAIHISEQVGIYIYGVGVAALQEMLLPPGRPGAEVRCLGGVFVYLYCPQPASSSSPAFVKSDEKSKTPAEANGRSTMTSTERTVQIRARSPIVTKKLQSTAPGSVILRRHRTKSPGLTAQALRPPSL